MRGLTAEDYTPDSHSSAAVLSMLMDEGEVHPGYHRKDEHDYGADYGRGRSAEALGKTPVASSPMV